MNLARGLAALIGRGNAEPIAETPEPVSAPVAPRPVVVAAPVVDEAPRPSLPSRRGRSSRATSAEQIAERASRQAGRPVGALAGNPAPSLQEAAGWEDTREQARALMRHRAYQLAERLIEDADPALILDLFERMTVVAPKQKDAGQQGITVIVGGVADVKIGVLTQAPGAAAGSDGPQ